MTMQARLGRAEQDRASQLRDLLRRLLEAGIVDAVLAPCRLGRGPIVAPTLVENAEMLGRCEPLAPLLPVNAATLVGRLTVSESKRRLAALLRPCELRALVELTKLHQADMTRVLVVSFDCSGTYDLNTYLKVAQCEEGMHGSCDEVDHPLRLACQMCEHPTPKNAALHIKLFGLPADSPIIVEADEGILSAVPDLEVLSRDDEALATWDKAAKALEQSRLQVRDRVLEEWRGENTDVGRLMERFAACTRCMNCMDMCPICYCKECIFRTPVFDHESRQYYRWAGRRGAVRLPAETLLFHLTRLNHMATSCIGCGLCDSACPNNLPVATLFRAVAQKVQGLFDYEAGRSFDDGIPLATFREDELKQYGI